MDNRQVTKEVIAAWAELLHRESLQACLWALNWHRSRSTEWLLPAHIVAGCREYRKLLHRQEATQRALTAGSQKVEPPPAWVREWLDGLKAKDEAVLDGGP